MTARQEKVREALRRVVDKAPLIPPPLWYADALDEVEEWEALLQTVGPQLKFATALIAEAEKLHPGITRQAGLAAGGTDTTS